MDEDMGTNVAVPDYREPHFARQATDPAGRTLPFAMNAGGFAVDDIVTRLRSTCKADKDCPHAPCLGYCLPLEAADEIERLRFEHDGHRDAAREYKDEIERLRADNAGLRFRLADLQRGIDHDPATCALLVCNRCDPWEDSRD